MKKIEKIESFLKLITEISKNGILIDSNLVYANLISLESDRENINHYFNIWQKHFEKIKNISVFVAPNWQEFCQFKSYGNSVVPRQKIKVYIPLDVEHIYYGVNQIFEFVAKNNISHLSKVSNSTRFDDVVLRLDDVGSVEKIREFVSKNPYIKEGLVPQNPFSFQDDFISITWDGNLSYNMVVSEWISDYINELKRCSRLDEASYIDFYQFLQRRYNEVFRLGKNINIFSQTRQFVEVKEDLLDYKYVTEILLSSLSPYAKLDNFYKKVESIKNEKNREEELLNLQRLLNNDVQMYDDITNEQREIFDYALIELSKKEGLEQAIKILKHFSKNGNYRVFTRTNNIRSMIMESGITPNIMDEFIFEEQKDALINALLETIKKYDLNQAGRALFGVREGNYGFFTSTNNARRNLRVMVEPQEIDTLITAVLKKEGRISKDMDDNYWLFLGLVNKMNKEKIK